MVIDRRKIELSTDISVSRYMNRLTRIANQEYIKKINGREGDKLSLSQPGFWFDPNSGVDNLVTPGNDMWIRGDIIDEDDFDSFLQMMMGGGSGEDDFEWSDIDQKYINMIFDNLELPNLTKKSVESEEREIVRCGFSTSGANIDLMKTFMNSIGRRMALKKPLEDKLIVMKENNAPKKQIEDLESQIKSVSFIDESDLRYRRYDEIVTPSKRMVMFLLLDISGSMGQEEKNLAKLFSKLVVSFLSKSYDKCEIEYIVFNDEAHSVDRHEFFYGTKSGGNTLYTALDLERKIIAEKYPQDWNIYTTIFSDTGMYGDDLSMSIPRLHSLLSLQQYMIYVNIYDNYISTLNELTRPFRSNPAFASCTVFDEESILNEFIKLFSKKGK